MKSRGDQNPYRFERAGRVLDVPISILDVDGIATTVAAAARVSGGYVAVCNVHSLVSASRDPELHRALHESIGNAADGMPLVWALRLLGYSGATRVVGRDLMERLLNGEALGVTRHFLIGSTEHVQARLLAAIQSRFPSAQVVGRWVPPFSSDAPELPSRVRDAIRSARPHVVWVGLGCPRQEKWMLRNWRGLAPSVLVGVGAAFDFLAGSRHVAPLWMQQLGLEWLFRLLSEPRRLAWRYLSTNPVFVWRFLREALRDRARARLGSPAQ